MKIFADLVCSSLILILLNPCLVIIVMIWAFIECLISKRPTARKIFLSIACLVPPGVGAVLYGIIFTSQAALRFLSWLTAILTVYWFVIDAGSIPYHIDNYTKVNSAHLSQVETMFQPGSRAEISQSNRSAILETVEDMKTVLEIKPGLMRMRSHYEKLRWMNAYISKLAYTMQDVKIDSGEMAQLETLRTAYESGTRFIGSDRP